MHIGTLALEIKEIKYFIIINNEKEIETSVQKLLVKFYL